MENKRILTNIEDKNGGKYNQYRPPYKTSNNNKNITVKKKNNINYIEEDNNNYVNEISEDKNQKIFKGFLNNYNQMNEYDTYMFPISAKDNITSIEETNIYNNNNNKKNNSSKNKSIKNVNMKTNNLIDIKNIKNINLNTNIHPSSLSPNKSNPLYNENINEQYDSKYSLKMNKIKDDYIDFLQKEFEDNAKKSIKLDSNNKELLKKCDDLIHDNRILSNLLSERTTHLNNIIQENLTVKSELDKSLITNQKNEQKLEFYEEQFNLYKASNENYQKIIQELKDQIAQLNLNITQIQKTNEEDKEQTEKDYQNNLKIELDNNKKEIEDLYENKIKEEKKCMTKKLTKC